MDRIDIIATLFLLIDHRKHDTSTVVMLLLIVCYAGVCVGRRAAGRAYCSADQLALAVATLMGTMQLLTFQ